MVRMAFGVVMCGLVSACWGADPGGDENAQDLGALEQPTREPASEGASANATGSEQALDENEGGARLACGALMRRQRECGARFIPALVDARVERDEPSGIAAHARAIGRDALLAEAFEEWALDSRDEAIESVCSEIAQSIAPERVQELGSSVSACLQQPGCDGFVACAVPVSFGRWKG